MMKTLNVCEADLLRWERVLVEDYPLLEKAVRTGNTQKGRRVFQLFRENLNWAGFAHAKGERSLVKDRLTTAAETFLLLRQEVEAHRADARFLAEAAEDALNVGLILVDNNYLERIRSLFAQQLEGSVAAYGKAAFCILYGSFKEALESIEELEQRGKLPYGGAVLLNLRALTSRDSEKFESALHMLLREFDRYSSEEARGTPEAALFLRGSALLSLHNQVQPVHMRATEIDPRLVEL